MFSRKMLVSLFSGAGSGHLHLLQSKHSGSGGGGHNVHGGIVVVLVVGGCVAYKSACKLRNAAE